MNKIQAMLVLLLVLAFGGAMAQAGDVKQAVLPPALVLPQGVELSDEELFTTTGRWGHVPGGAAIGAVSGASAKLAENIRDGRPLHHNVLEAAGTGAVIGAVAGGKIVKTVVERAGHLIAAYRVVDYWNAARKAAAGAFSGWFGW